MDEIMIATGLGVVKKVIKSCFIATCSTVSLKVVLPSCLEFMKWGVDRHL